MIQLNYIQLGPETPRKAQSRLYGTIMGFHVLSESTEAASGAQRELMSGKRASRTAVFRLIKDSDGIKSGTETDSKKNKKMRDMIRTRY